MTYAVTAYYNGRYAMPPPPPPKKKKIKQPNKQTNKQTNKPKKKQKQKKGKVDLTTVLHIRVASFAYEISCLVLFSNHKQ